MKNKKLLIIGGFDPSAHAGVLADRRVLEYYQLPHRIALTAVTAQSKKKFWNWQPISLPLFQDQLRSVAGNLVGVKIGMIATSNHAKIVEAWLNKTRPVHSIWDPVLKSSTGITLLKSPKWNSKLQTLLERVQAITPNLPEAEWILGKKIKNLTQMEHAAESLYQLGKKRGRWVLLKGGHLAGKQKIDIYYDGKTLQTISSPTKTGSPRGTGCTLASAILAQLYLGKTPLQACRLAKAYVRRQLF